MLLTLLLPVLALAQVPDGDITLRSGGLSAVVSAAAGWTITTLDYDGARLLVPAGGQGAVINPRGGDWQGSRMAGGEQVSALEFSVDGEQVPLPLPRQLAGERITVNKTSTIGALSHRAETTFEPDQFLQRHRFTATEDVDLASFYAFIYSVTPQAGQYLAGTPFGEEQSGELTSSGAHLVHRDAAWLAHYDPEAGAGLVWTVITPLPGPGAAVRTWDHALYRKLLVQPLSGKIDAGTEFDFSMAMRCFEATPGEWQDAARATAADLQERYARQDEAPATESPYHGPGVPSTGLLTLQSGPYRIPVAADRAWTIHEFHHGEHMLGHSQGYYGTVLVPDVEGGNWIGTGHTEGGREVVHTVSLTVDGQEHPLVMGRTVTGERLELTKESTIHAFTGRTTITVTPQEVIQHQELTATEDVRLRILYLFMHCWVPTTTRWMAELPAGEFIEGEFENEGFKVRRDTRWVAQYEPEMGVAILQYTPRVASGTGSYTQIWDIPRYHKHYTQRAAREAFSAGDRLDYTMTVQIVPGETGDWEATKAAARALKERYPPE